MQLLKGAYQIHAGARLEIVQYLTVSAQVSYHSNCIDRFFMIVAILISGSDLIGIVKIPPGDNLSVVERDLFKYRELSDDFVLRRRRCLSGRRRRMAYQDLQTPRYLYS